MPAFSGPEPLLPDPLPEPLPPEALLLPLYMETAMSSGKELWDTADLFRTDGSARSARALSFFALGQMLAEADDAAFLGMELRDDRLSELRRQSRLPIFASVHVCLVTISKTQRFSASRGTPRRSSSASGSLDSSS
jgi:hypothetical protein